MHTFDYRVAREFWGIGDPRLALLTHAIVGGSPAYRDYVRGDAPKSLRGFADWVVRAVLDPASPLLKEARYLLTEDQDLRGLPLYHSVLAAVASGHTLRGAIASYLGRKTTDLAHPLAVLEDAGYLIRADDVFRSRRPVWRIAEPLVGFYHAIMRPNWADLERPGRAAQVWDGMARTFQSQVMGPHFERICRVWSMLFADPATGAGTFARSHLHRGHGDVFNVHGRDTPEALIPLVRGADEVATDGTGDSVRDPSKHSSLPRHSYDNLPVAPCLVARRG